MTHNEIERCKVFLDSLYRLKQKREKIHDSIITIKVFDSREACENQATKRNMNLVVIDEVDVLINLFLRMISS